MIIKYTVDKNTDKKVLKQLLKSQLGISGRFIKKLKYSSRIFCNGAPVYVNHVVNTGDVIEVFMDFVEEAEDIIPESIPIDILYEDDSLIALNKQPNIVVHPTFSHPTGTIANAVMHHFTENGLNIKIRPVSRLDRDTSGIIIFAKNPFVQEALIRQMKNKDFKKEYIGVVHDNVEKSKGTIDLPIDRKPDSIMLRHISPSGQPSVTHFEVIEQLKNASYLKFILETGRTHQIRVHCLATGHPLIGDTLYSDIESPNISRQALHSRKVSFIHPLSNKNLELHAPIPKDILQLLNALRK